MFGAEDQVIASAYAEEFRHGLRGAEAVTVPRAGHMLPYERPAEVASQVMQFLIGG
jgi:pimeloyl-ACP methyl ester carboxylesterase